MARKMTGPERGDRCREAMAAALDALRRDDPVAANEEMLHAVHDGVPPFELVAEIVRQTGGRL